jgi:hypothetical protein
MDYEESRFKHQGLFDRFVPDYQQPAANFSRRRVCRGARIGSKGGVSLSEPLPIPKSTLRPLRAAANRMQSVPVQPTARGVLGSWLGRLLASSSHRDQTTARGLHFTPRHYCTTLPGPLLTGIYLCHGGTENTVSNKGK